MKKFDNFTNCLAVLANADFKMERYSGFCALKDTLAKKLVEAESDWT